MFARLETGARAPSALMATKKTRARIAAPAADTGQADRLKRLREALGYDTALGFAKMLGVVPQRWYNFENGLPLSKEIAFQLVRTVPGLTLDWLFFGKPDGLPLELARRLGEVPRLPPGNLTT